MEFKVGDEIMAWDKNGRPFKGKYEWRCLRGAAIVRDSSETLHHVEEKDIIFPRRGDTLTHDPAMDRSKWLPWWMSLSPWNQEAKPEAKFVMDEWAQAPKKDPPEPMYLVYLGDGDALDHDPDDEKETPFLEENQALACAKKQANQTGQTVGVYAKTYEVKPGEPKVIPVIRFKGR